MDRNRKQQDAVSRVPETLVLCTPIATTTSNDRLSYRSGETARVAEEQRRIAERVLNENSELLSALKYAEAGQRGFPLAGDEQYLEPFTQAMSVIPGILNRVKDEIINRPDQAERMRAIKPLVHEKLAELKKTIALHRAKKEAEALAVGSPGPWKGAHG